VWHRVKPGLPEVKLLAAGHFSNLSRDWTFSQQHGDEAGWCDGTTFHPYGKPGLWTPVSPAIEAELVRRYARGKDGRLWITEVNAPGCWFHQGLPPSSWRFQTARSVAPIYLGSQLGAAPMPITTMMFKIDPGHRSSNEDDWFNMYDKDAPGPEIAAYAAMTAALEDTELIGDAWVGTRLGFAPVYRRAEGGSVAALWSESRFPAESWNDSDLIELEIDLPAAGLDRVRDLYGRSVTADADGHYRLRGGTRATFYVDASCSAEQLRTLLQAARFTRREALDVRPLPLTRPPDMQSTVRLRVTNQSLQTRTVRLDVKPPVELTVTATSASRNLAPGEEWITEFPISTGRRRADNRYAVAWTVHSDGHELAGNAETQVACALHGSPVIDGHLDDWSNALWTSIRHVGPLTDWWKTKPSMTIGEGYRLALQWDERFLYVAAQLPDQTTRYGAEDHGLEYRVNSDDGLIIGFAHPEPNPEDILRSHPLHAKCMTSDLGWEFSSQLSQEGPQLMRLAAPGTAYQQWDARGSLPTNPPIGPKLGLIPGAQVQVRYDAASTAYVHELAIPWTELPFLRQRLQGLKAGASTEAALDWMVSDQHRWASLTRYCEELGLVEPAAQAMGWRFGTPCWKNDYPTRLRIAWGFIR
jgi:hypothetical protein